MKYQSQDFAIRVQDALTFNAILSEIYFIMHDKFVVFLSFYEEEIGSVKDNFIKEETIKVLNNKGMPEKILGVYINNVKFFNKKYSLTESSISSKVTKEEKARVIFEKIIDDIKIEDSTLTLDNLGSYLNLANFLDFVFGKQNENIIECPIIVQDVFDYSTYLQPTNDGRMSSTFFNFKNTKNNSFYKMIPSADVNPLQIPKKYYFDKEYLEKFNSFIYDSGFHFERFICFDFVPQQFISALAAKDVYSELLSNDTQLEEFFFSCLNSSLFLYKQEEILRDVKINREYFKKIFPIAVTQQAGEPNLYYDLFRSYIPLFMTNIRHGIRLVWRSASVIEGDKSVTNIDYNVDIISDKILNKKSYISNDNEVIKNLSDYQKYKGTSKKQSFVTFSSLEYNIIKEKSYVLFYELGEGVNKKLFRKRQIPICNAYGKKYDQPFSIQSLHNFIDDEQNIYLNEVKKSIQLQNVFIDVFTKVIPLSQIFTIYKMNKTTSIQNNLNILMSSNIDQQNATAKSLQSSINNTLDNLLKDPKEY